MLVKGDKIKLIKAIPGFDKVGDIFEINEILEGGMIRLDCSYGTGLMSYSEFEGYFEKIKTRKWGEWFYWVRADGHYLYRTNGKKIELKIGDLKVSASCNDCDVFQLREGLNLCLARIRVKQAQLALNQLLRTM